MACSDNVVRAGLTPKFKDVTTLCDILDCHCRPASDNIFLSKPHPLDSFITIYDPPVPEFTVEQISVCAVCLVLLLHFYLAEESVDGLWKNYSLVVAYLNTRTHLVALFLGLPGWVGTRKVQPIWILLKQETVSGSGISWVICKSAPCSRQITMPAPHHSVFLQARYPSCHPTNSVKAVEAYLKCAWDLQIDVAYVHCVAC